MDGATREPHEGGGHRSGHGHVPFVSARGHRPHHVAVRGHCREPVHDVLARIGQVDQMHVSRHGVVHGRSQHPPYDGMDGTGPRCGTNFGVDRVRGTVHRPPPPGGTGERDLGRRRIGLRRRGAHVVRGRRSQEGGVRRRFRRARRRRVPPPPPPPRMRRATRSTV